MPFLSCRLRRTGRSQQRLVFLGWPLPEEGHAETQHVLAWSEHPWPGLAAALCPATRRYCSLSSASSARDSGVLSSGASSESPLVSKFSVLVPWHGANCGDGYLLSCHLCLCYLLPKPSFVFAVELGCWAPHSLDGLLLHVCARSSWFLS